MAVMAKSENGVSATFCQNSMTVVINKICNDVHSYRVGEESRAKDTNWAEAKSWVNSLDFDGGGWRMPTMDELEGLYKKGVGSRNMTPLLKTHGWLVWSGEVKGSLIAGDFLFFDGRKTWISRDHAKNGRAFAVRFRNHLKSKKFEIASLSKKTSPTKPSSSASKVIKRDGQYVAYANGIVKDTRTGLEWKAGPDKDTDWNEARSWVQSLGGDWRMPKIDELERLYEKGKGGGNITPLLMTNSWNVWSGEKKDSSMVYYYIFGFGRKFWRPPSDGKISRALAVRSQNRSNGVKTASIASKPLYSKSPSSTSKAIKRDGQYLAYANGIVKTQRRVLSGRLDPIGIWTWNEAQSWVQSLRGGWRMPTVDELAKLYKKGKGNRNMTPLLKTDGWFIWSGEKKRSSEAWWFHFRIGKKTWAPRSQRHHALAVRQ
jgi:hypothetical protein